MMTLTALLVALCVGMGIGALASWWRGRSFAWWAIIGGAGALLSPGIVAAAGIGILAILEQEADDRTDNFSSSGLGDDD